MSAECKKLRGPNDTGPDCGCRGDACALGRDAAKRQDDPVLSLEEQMSNVQIITVLWRHYFAENHEGDFVDCTDPACAPFTHEVRRGT